MTSPSKETICFDGQPCDWEQLGDFVPNRQMWSGERAYARCRRCKGRTWLTRDELRASEAPRVPSPPSVNLHSGDSRNAPTDEHCGCANHGDHHGCNETCREYEGCRVPTGRSPSSDARSRLNYLLENVVEGEDGQFTFPDGVSYPCRTKENV